MSCGGWLNCLLYSLTRSIFLVSGSQNATAQDQRRSRYAVGTVNGAIELTKSVLHPGKYGEIPSPVGSTENIVHLSNGEQTGLESKNEGVIMETTWEIKTESNFCDS